MSGEALVLFAVDGVLVDSAAIRTRCWLKTLAEHGVSVERASFQRRFEGRSDAAIVRSIETELGRKLPAALIADYEARARLAYERELRSIEDVRGTLKRLRSPLCAVSGSSVGLARHGLEVTGLWDLFAPNLFTTAMVEQEPPAPHLAHFAAAQMGVPVGRAILVDASVNGVRGGLAAGMTAFGFAGAPHARPEALEPKLEAAGATLVFDRMSALAPLVRARAA